MGEFSQWFAEKDRETDKDVERELNNLGIKLTAGVKGGTPAGATGFLGESIGFKVSGQGKSSKLIFGAGANYAPAVEHGAKPHWAPIGALTRWAKQRGINPYALQASIAKKGTKKHPFFWKPVNTLVGMWRPHW